MKPLALISVLDKTGIEKLAAFLVQRGYDLLSTGGTAKCIRNAGLTVLDVEDYTGSPEMLHGRVKILHPKIFGGILACPTDADRAELANHAIREVNVVVVNLYDFEGATAKPGATVAIADENTDVGGPSVINAAAKNWLRVTVATSPNQYEELMSMMNEKGETPKYFRYRQKQQATWHLANYFKLIADFHDAHFCDD